MLDGSSSFDPDNLPQPLSFGWSFVSLPAGSSLTNADIMNGNMAVASFVPDLAGMYMLRLDVSDSEDGDFDQVVIDVQAGEPPSAPENLVGRAKQFKVSVKWSGSPTATSFTVFRRLDSEIDFSLIGATEAFVFVDNLPQGTLSAEYFVVAENEFGVSDESDVVVVSPTLRRRR